MSGKQPLPQIYLWGELASLCIAKVRAELEGESGFWGRLSSENFPCKGVAASDTGHRERVSLRIVPIRHSQY